MLTSNFYIGRFLQTCRYVGGASLLQVKNYGGNIATVTPTATTDTRLIPEGVSNSTSPSAGYLMFGTNDAEESITDYTLSLVGRTFTSTLGSYTINTQDKKIIVSRRYIINNNISSPFTIKEFGIFEAIGGQSCLIYRGVIEAFTIEANETVNFDLTLEYDMPAEFESFVN